MEGVFRKLRARDRARSEEEECDSTILKSLYVNKDPLVIDHLFPRLQSKLLDPSFQAEFLRHYKASLTRKRDGCVEMAKRCEAADSDSKFYTVQLPALDRALAVSSFSEYQAFLQDPHEGHPGIIELMTKDVERHGDHESDRYVGQTYHLYEVSRILYEHYVSRVTLFERFDHPMSVRLIDLYRQIQIDLEASDTQFSKYRLLSMGSAARITNTKESQAIVDERIGLHFGIHVPRYLLMAIEQVIADKLVARIAFHIESIMDATPAFEDLEYGALFSFDALQLPDVSKLYDGEMCGDSLWVKVDKQKLSMTFEELCTDFPEFDGTVVTQVVHMELFQEKGRYFIGHLDHEYILYMLNQYVDRETDARVKGHRKVKTFKIDGARIPFDFKFEGRYFMFVLLDAYFKNKALVKEYFSRAVT